MVVLLTHRCSPVGGWEESFKSFDFRRLYLVYSEVCPYWGCRAAFASVQLLSLINLTSLNWDNVKIKTYLHLQVLTKTTKMFFKSNKMWVLLQRLNILFNVCLFWYQCPLKDKFYILENNVFPNKQHWTKSKNCSEIVTEGKTFSCWIASSSNFFIINMFQSVYREWALRKSYWLVRFFKHDVISVESGCSALFC